MAGTYYWLKNVECKEMQDNRPHEEDLLQEMELGAAFKLVKFRLPEELHSEVTAKVSGALFAEL